MGGGFHIVLPTEKQIKKKGDFKMKKYEKPELEVNLITTQDIMHASAYDNLVSDTDWQSVEDLLK